MRDNDTELGIMKKEKISIRGSNLDVVIVVSGLYVCFLASTVLQEKLYAFRVNNVINNESGDRFESAPLLTLVKSLTSVMVSRLILYFHKDEQRIKPSGTTSFIMASIRCSSTMLSLYSLKFISYPYLVIGRSVKIIPVLVSEFLFDHRVPPVRRCLSVTVTTIGLFVFSSSSFIGDNTRDNNKGRLGCLLLFLSLCADGGLSFSQRHMVREKNKKPHVIEAMFYMASWQALFSLLVVFLSRGGRGGVSFCFQNPEVMGLMLWPSIIESIGQIFIYELVIHHGPFFTSLVTTLRKFITIVLSVVLFGHILTTTQCLAILMVFLGCFIDMKKPTIKK